MTSRLLRLFKRPKSIWIYVFGISASLFLLLICSIAIEQSKQDAEYVKLELLPLSQHVEMFRNQNHRLPTKLEFQAWSEKTYENQSTFYYPEKPKFMSDWGENGKDFVVGKWRGEWNQFYRSWDYKTFEAQGE